MKTNGSANINVEYLNAFSDAISTLPAVTPIFNRDGSCSLIEECEKLIEKCQNLFRAEVCAIFIVRNGMAVLEAHRGYEGIFGLSIDFQRLREKLKYRVDPPDKSEDEVFDGITGWVASTGKEFGANNWEEIRKHKSYEGKPDQLGIWGPEKPFRCMFAVPLKVFSKTIGVLKVENKIDPEKRGVTFDETDKVLMRTLVKYFSMAIENAYYQSQLREDNKTEKIPIPKQLPQSFFLETIENNLVRLDNSNMAKVIERIPTQIEIALKQKLPSIHGESFNKVLIAGMGGSALPAEIVMDAFANHINVPVIVNRNYDLHSSVDEKSLIIISSFSGNTEETLSVIEQLDKKASNVIVVSADGRLTALANERRYPLIKIPIQHEPKGFQPRSALGYFVTYFARLLNLAGIMESITNELESVPNFLRQIEIRKDAENAAIWLKDRIPVIYTDELHQMSIARIAKIKFNENAKRPAFFNFFPEANHNEMIGFSKEGLGNFGILYLHDPDSHPRIKDRFNVMREVFKREKLNHVDFWKWGIPGEMKIQKIFAALVFADWCSYTLAILDGFDPTPVALVEKFKNVLINYNGKTIKENIIYLKSKVIV